MGVVNLRNIVTTQHLVNMNDLQDEMLACRIKIIHFRGADMARNASDRLHEQGAKRLRLGY